MMMMMMMMYNWSWAGFIVGWACYYKSSHTRSNWRLLLSTTMIRLQFDGRSTGV